MIQNSLEDYISEIILPPLKKAKNTYPAEVQGLIDNNIALDLNAILRLYNQYNNSQDANLGSLFTFL